jgi:predicted O-linked N-acetylglucosamine transferase (SPINDLY family)
MSGSLLHALEMLELVAATLTQYEQIALHLARAPDHLASLRTALLHRVATRPLFQTDRLRRHLESAFTTMVERGRRNEPPASLRIQAIGY